MNDHISSLIALIDSRIEEQRFGEAPLELYEPIRYIMNLNGKRIRPLMAILAYRLFRDDIDEIVGASLAIEMFHNFTLMHDDIMDKAPIRRGFPTVHEKWNSNTAILSGDAMMIKAYDQLLAIDPLLLPHVIREFNDCAIKVCEGQQLDMNYELLATVSEEQYIQMISLKTAALIGFSLNFGGILACASPSDCRLLKEFGYYMGLGFQLMDDLLDVYADKDKFGKQVGGDIIANKKTYLLIKALECAGKEDRGSLEQWISKKEFDSAEKVASVVEIYDRLNIKAVTEKAIGAYFRDGLARLDAVSAADEKKTDLKKLVHYLIYRDK